MRWNARSAVSNKQSLKQFLVNEDIDIALISETWFKPNKTYSFVGYNIVRQDRYDGITGTAILIKREYQFVEIDIDQNAINSDISLCAIKLKLPNNNNLTLASLYKSPQIVTTSQDWKNCFDLFSEPCIIGVLFVLRVIFYNRKLNFLEALKINKLKFSGDLLNDQTDLNNLPLLILSIGFHRAND
nr:unnamed protein product [Callosobruchus chinensis]